MHWNKNDYELTFYWYLKGNLTKRLNLIDMWDTLATKMFIDNEIIRQWLIKKNISVY